MRLAACADMLNRAFLSAVLVAATVPVYALTLDDLRVQATLVQGSPKDPSESTVD
jgi:hypothetical protein